LPIGASASRSAYGPEHAACSAVQRGDMAASALPDGREIALDSDDDVTRPAGLDARHGVECFVPGCTHLVEVSPLDLDCAEVAERHAVGTGELLTPARGHTPLEVDLRVEGLTYIAQSAGRLVGEGGFLEEADAGGRFVGVGPGEVSLCAADGREGAGSVAVGRECAGVDDRQQRLLAVAGLAVAVAGHRGVRQGERTARVPEVDGLVGEGAQDVAAERSVAGFRRDPGGDGEVALGGAVFTGVEGHPAGEVRHLRYGGVRVAAELICTESAAEQRYRLVE